MGDAELPRHAGSHSPRSTSIQTVTVTCCRDERAHEVPDVELAAAAERRDGRLRAICGHILAAAPMVAPDGPPCPLCAAVRAVKPREKQARWREWVHRFVHGPDAPPAAPR
jgi:hypothetical protein